MSTTTYKILSNGIQSQWSIPFNAESITSVTVNSIPIDYTNPNWFTLKTNVNIPKDSTIEVVYTRPEVSSKTQTITSAITGEVKLFALQGSEVPPTGWELDATRDVSISDLAHVALMPVYSSNLHSTAISAIFVQLNQSEYISVTTDYIRKSNVGSIGDIYTIPVPATYSSNLLPAACNLDGNLFMVGGKITSGAVTNRVYEHDTTTGVTTVKANLPIGVMDAAAVSLSGGRVLVVGGYRTSATTDSFNGLQVYTKSSNTWVTLNQTLDEAVVRPHLVTLPSGKIGIFSGGVSGYTVVSNKYYIFDPDTLTLSAAKTIPLQYLPVNAYANVTLRTQNGAAYVCKDNTLAGNHFCEYNEFNDFFSTYQLMLPAGFSGRQNSSLYTQAQDLTASKYGHLIFPSSVNQVYTAVKSNLIPSYRYLRKT